MKRYKNTLKPLQMTHNAPIFSSLHKLSPETPPTVLPWGRVGGQENLDPFSSVVGAITLAYVRNRICAPRDMSAGAATAFRTATDKLLTSLY